MHGNLSSSGEDSQTSTRPLVPLPGRSNLPRPVSRALECLNRDEEITLDGLAAEAGVNKCSLVRQFRRVMGTTPMRYLVTRRVERACALLTRGVPATVAAVDCGFYDQSHMNRWFKRLVGMTPRQYARAAA